MIHSLFLRTSSTPNDDDDDEESEKLLLRARARAFARISGDTTRRNRVLACANGIRIYGALADTDDDDAGVAASLHANATACSRPKALARLLHTVLASSATERAHNNKSSSTSGRLCAALVALASKQTRARLVSETPLETNNNNSRVLVVVRARARVRRPSLCICASDLCTAAAAGAGAAT